MPKFSCIFFWFSSNEKNPQVTCSCWSKYNTWWEGTAWVQDCISNSGSTICRKPRRVWVPTPVWLLLIWAMQSFATCHCQTWQPKCTSSCTYTKSQIQNQLEGPAVEQSGRGTNMERATSTGTKSACCFVSCFWTMESNQESTSGFLWMKNESGITSEKTPSAPAGSAITSLSSAHLAGRWVQEWWWSTGQ